MRVEPVISAVGPDDRGRVTIEVRLDPVDGSFLTDAEGVEYELHFEIYCSELQFERTQRDPGGLIGAGALRVAEGGRVAPCAVTARVRPGATPEHGVVPLLVMFSQGGRHGWSTNAEIRVEGPAAGPMAQRGSR